MPPRSEGTDPSADRFPVPCADAVAVQIRQIQQASACNMMPAVQSDGQRGYCIMMPSVKSDGHGLRGYCIMMAWGEGKLQHAASSAE